MTRDYAKSIVPPQPGFRIRLRWVLLLVVVAVFAYLGKRTYVQHHQASTVVKDSGTAQKVGAQKPDEQKAKSSELPLPKGSERITPEFDFYTVLPKRDDLLPSDATADKKTAQSRQFLQVIASKDIETVKQLQERLVLMGFESEVKESKDQSGERLYHLLVGPYATRADAKLDQERLKQSHIDSIFYRR